MKKGDRVYYIISYDYKAAVLVREGIVKSFGKKQATLQICENGKMLKSLILPYDYDKLFSCESIDDVNAFALGLANYYKKYYIQSNIDCVQRSYLFDNSTSSKYFEAMKSDCLEIINAEPSVVLFKNLLT